MKKVAILVSFILLVCVAMINSHNVEESEVLSVGVASLHKDAFKKDGKQEQISQKQASQGKCHFPPPWDRNCNGIPDIEE